ncbi:MAG TPA: hydrogen peroxide-dependent heme synthase [Acidobacteriaceae bacterium]|nr:hydrogen peroxide-dependent heme synthase [Acidobacteriaceae bacterium]
MPETPPFPLTLDGSAVLHQMFRFDWPAWRRMETSARNRTLTEATALLSPMEQGSGGDRPSQSAIFAQLGHKGDLMLIHFRDSIEQLATVQRDVARTELGSFLQPTHSYLSIVELGLYESSVKTYPVLTTEGLEPYSDEWEKRLGEVAERQAAAMASRLFPSMPQTKYVCFYPMDKRRGERVNWYSVPIRDRARMMQEHGLIGRRFAGTVKQIISGSIGLDDWEWGVDLFADNPGVFKRLIYEMRFDEASALYGLFGAFYVGVRLPVSELASWLATEEAK